MKPLLIFCWILAFVGVALIYLVPWVISLVKKEAAPETTQYLLKGVGVFCSVVGMLVLFTNGGLK